MCSAHVAVHHVELDPVDTRILEPLALGTHVRPVSGQHLHRKQNGPCGQPARPRRLLGRGGPALGAARVRIRRRQESYLAEDVPLWLRRCGGTDGMICTGLGSPYSMFVPALRAAALLPTAGAATKPCESALTRYSICAVGDAGSDEDEGETQVCRCPWHPEGGIR